jgi:hypothetical protein
MKMKMNINKFICRGSTDQNEDGHQHLSDKEEWSSKGITGCGVFPIYGRSSSRDESVEAESNIQAIGAEFDFDEFDSLGLDARSVSRDERVEDESDIDDLEHSLGLDGRSISGVEIDELQSMIQKTKALKMKRKLKRRRRRT